MQPQNNIMWLCFKLVTLYGLNALLKIFLSAYQISNMRNPIELSELKKTCPRAVHKRKYMCVCTLVPQVLSCNFQVAKVKLAFGHKYIIQHQLAFLVLYRQHLRPRQTDMIY